MVEFSVIVPLYNCEKYIAECIDSILNQQYENFELIVVNDGSTDSSRRIVEAYTDKRIRIIDKENGGLLHARLTGLREAKNEYIVFVDADDRIADSLLKDLAPIFSSGADCVIYKLREFCGDTTSEEPKGLFENNRVFLPDEKNTLLEKLLTTGDINSLVYKSFKKGLVNVAEMEVYPRIAIGEDGLFTLQLFKNYEKVVYLDKVYYEYRQSQDSMTHKLRFSNYTDNAFRFQLYYETARQYFDINLESILDKIDRLFFRMVLSILINSRTTIESKSDYQEIVKRISQTDIFQEKMRTSCKKQNVLYKAVLKSIAKNKIGSLMFFRLMFRIIF